MSGPPCVLAVHAHPDDESSKAAATMAMYSARGVRTVLVTCTGGEAGEVVDPDVVDAAVDLGATRAVELAEAIRILGFAATYQLGYRDSGMTGDADGAFAHTPIDDVVTDLVEIFRAERPDVIVTYDPTYAAAHPDHLRCHDACALAFARAADGGWRPAKLYGTRTHSPGRLAAMQSWLRARGKDSPYADALAAATEDLTTTRVHVGDHLPVAREALLAHRSQVRPDDPWFFAVPLDALQEIHPWDDYQLLASDVPLVRDTGGYEADLLAGLT
jgi:mycothiol S-conjugate amidase